MTKYHRHKQRVLTTIITLLIFTVALDAYLILASTLGMELSLFFAFTVAIGLTTAYQCYNYRHSHEHLTLVNTLTQIFLGSVLFISLVVILLLNVFFGVDILDSYLYLSIIVIVFTFVFLKKFDEFLEYEVRHKSFTAAAAPRRAKKKRVRK